MSGVITAAVVGAVAVGASAYEASQSNSIAGQELGLAKSTQGEQQYYNRLLQQLIANPSSVTSLPGYSFEQQAGSAAVADQMAASGFAGSGNEAAALDIFGQGLASSFYQQQTSLLANLAGVTSASSPASAAGAATGASALSTSTLNNLFSNLGISTTLLSKLGQGTAAAGTPAASDTLASADTALGSDL